MTHQELKYKIKKKYGSVQRYFRLSGKTMKDFNNAIKSKKEKEFWAACSKTKNVIIPEEDLTEDLLKSIRDKIYTDHKNQIEFCRATGFSNTWLSALLSGNFKRKSKKVKSLLIQLKIK